MLPIVLSIKYSTTLSSCRGFPRSGIVMLTNIWCAHKYFNNNITTTKTHPMNASLAYGNFFKPSTSVSVRNGTAIVTGRQPVSFSGGYAVWPLNPTYNSGRLATEARLYSQWKCTRLRVMYMPDSAATESGHVDIGTLDFGISPTSLSDHLVNSNGGSRSTVWQPMSTNVTTHFYCDRWRPCYGTLSAETNPTNILALVDSPSTLTPSLVVEYTYQLVNRVTDTAEYSTYTCTATPVPILMNSYVSTDANVTQFGAVANSMTKIGDLCMPLSMCPAELTLVAAESDSGVGTAGNGTPFFKSGDILGQFMQATLKVLINRTTGMHVRNNSSIAVPDIMGLLFKSARNGLSREQ